MHRNLEYEQEISLKDLFFSVMYRWRSILVAALIGAIILGTYQYVTLTSTHSKGELTNEERQYDIDYRNYYVSMESYQREIMSLTDQLAARKDYRDNSPYLKLDPQNVWIAEKRYYVEVDPSVMEALPEGSPIDPTDYVLAVYASAMREDMDEAELEEFFGTTNLTYIGEQAWVSTSAGDNTFSVASRASTPEEAEKLLSYVVKRIESLRDGKAQDIEPHKVVLINESVSRRVDNNVTTSQIQVKNDIAGYQKSLDTAIDNLNKLELDGEPDKPGTHVKKMAAIGFIVGAFLLAGVYAVIYVLNGKLTGGDSLADQYGIPLLGEFHRSQARTPGKWPDKWIEAMEQGKTTQDESSVVEHIAELVTDLAPDGSLLLVSTEREEKLAEFVKLLSGKLNGRKITCCADFLSSTGAISTAGQADAVIIVEEKNISYLKKIDRMADLLITSKAKVIGAVVL